MCIFISVIIQSGYSCWGYCHVHCKFDFLGTRNPEKVLLLVTLWLFVGQKCKNVFFDGGHFESSNMATPLKIGFGSRQIWIQQVKMYLCTKFDAFVQICTFIPLTALTIPQRRADRFWHKIRQTTRFRATKCLFGVVKPISKVQTPIFPKNPQFRQDRFFRPKTLTSDGSRVNGP